MSISLNELNKYLSRKISARMAGVYAGIVMGLVLLSYYGIRGWLLIPPDPSGDETAYLSIGWELSRGNGFTRDFSQPHFQKFYQQFLVRPPEATIDDGLPDTTRPPLFPTIIAILDLISPGHQLWPIRCWNILCLAIVGGLSVRTVGTRFGILPGMLVIPIFLILDMNTRLYGRAILTEATTTLLIAVLAVHLTQFYGFARYFHQINWHSLIFGSVMLLLSILLRNNTLLWVPFIAGGVVLSLMQPDRKQWIRNSILTTSVMMGILIVGYLPWAIRNINVTGRFMPIGTQGAMQMSAAYGDGIWASRGVWVNLDALGFFENLDTRESEPISRRIQRAKYSQQAANKWIRSHPGQTALLPLMKVGQAILPRNLAEGCFLFFVLIGLWNWRSDPLKTVFVILIAACLTGIGATWSVEGRFLVPLMFVWHCLAAVGLSRCLGLKLSESLNNPTVN